MWNPLKPQVNSNPPHLLGLQIYLINLKMVFPLFWRNFTGASPPPLSALEQTNIIAILSRALGVAGEHVFLSLPELKCVQLILCAILGPVSPQGSCPPLHDRERVSREEPWHNNRHSRDLHGINGEAHKAMWMAQATCVPPSLGYRDPKVPEPPNAFLTRPSWCNWWWDSEAGVLVSSAHISGRPRKIARDMPLHHNDAAANRRERKEKRGGTKRGDIRGVEVRASSFSSLLFSSTQ